MGLTIRLAPARSSARPWPDAIVIADRSASATRVKTSWFEGIASAVDTNMTSRTFEYDNGPIAIGDHAWVGALAMILRRVTVVGKGAVVAARCKVSRDVPTGALMTGGGLSEHSR